MRPRRRTAASRSTSRCPRRAESGATARQRTRLSPPDRARIQAMRRLPRVPAPAGARGSLFVLALLALLLPAGSCSRDGATAGGSAPRLYFPQLHDMVLVKVE